MGLNQTFFLIFLLFFSPFFLCAQQNDADIGDPDDFYDALFDFAYGTNGEENTSCLVVFGNGDPPIGMSTHLTNLADVAADARLATNNETIRYSKDGGMTVNITFTGNICNGQTTGYPFVREQFICDFGENCSWRRRTNMGSIGGGQAQGVPTTSYTCPHPDRPHRKVQKYLDAAPFCFGQDDLNMRDSCPDSTQDGAYALPVTTFNNQNVMCQDKADGSSCKYRREGNAFITDFENDCYELNGLPRYDDSGLTQPDPAEPECQDIGTAARFCKELEENVCDSNGLCNSGCGSVAIGNSAPIFGCISGDTDGDGLADYLDPDLDGDGIRNEDDLDKDGDGKDDPTLPTPRELPISTTALEGLAAQTNAALANANLNLEGIKEELEKQNGSGAMPNVSVGLADRIAEQTAMSRIKASDISVALESMTTFINFGSGASCPNFSFALGDPINQTIATTIHCELMPLISNVITPVMYALYLWAGFRIFASA
jgi:hypothetical protein